MTNEQTPNNDGLETNDELVQPDAQDTPEVPKSTDVVNDADGDTGQAAAAISGSLVTGMLGYVNFDSGGSDNNTTGAMVSPEFRQNFRRDTYVLITDTEQGYEFLGRVVEGPFHTPHEVGAESAITRTTVLNPERTRFRPSYYVYGTIEVLGQLIGNDRVVPTPTRPRPYSQISEFPAGRLRELLGITGDFLLGSLMGYEDVKVSADPTNKNFLPRNVGIFGTVGSGKSNTTQVLMEEAIAAGWAVIVVDVEGEYVRMNEPSDDPNLKEILKDTYNLKPEGIGDFRVYVPSSGASDAVRPIRFKVPISGLDSYVLADIQEFTEPQIRMFERVVAEIRRRSASTPRAARLGSLGAPAVAPFVAELNVVKANHPSVAGLGDDIDQLIAKYSPSTGNSPYTLQDMINVLDDTTFTNSLGNTDRAPAYTLRSKLFSLGRSGMLDWNATNSTAYLPEEDLLVGGRLSILDVSETDDRSRNIAIAYVLQTLFNKVIETDVNEPLPHSTVPRPKVMVILEEVHTFVSRASANKMKAVLDNLQVISRRGRKRWMSLGIVSQQPGHVPDELFELANTRFIHQLKSASNLAPVKATTGGVHEALWATMPSLGPGQCLLTGAVFRNPLFVNIRPAKTKRLLTT